MLDSLTKQLTDGGSLSAEQVRDAIGGLTDEAVTPEAKADFLTALADKGETPEEIAAFASELRDKALPVPLDDETRGREMLDVCGTGGDKLGTFNISTTVAIVAAALTFTSLSQDPFHQCDKQCRSAYGFYDRSITGARTGVFGQRCACQHRKLRISLTRCRFACGAVASAHLSSRVVRHRCKRRRRRALGTYNRKTRAYHPPHDLDA